MVIRIRHTLNRLISEIEKTWTHDERLHWKKVAERYAQRAWMDGDTIRRTGEVIPRDSA